MSRAETRLLKLVILDEVILKLCCNRENLERTSGSRLGFFISGLMTAVLNADGLWPAKREWFMFLVMSGETAETLAFSRAEEKGSTVHR